MSIQLRLAGGGPTQSQERVKAQARNRHSNERAIIENPLSHLSDEELEQDVRSWASNFLPTVDVEKLLRAARVAKDIRMYDEVARCPDAAFGADLQVLLTAEERRALKRERDVTFSEKGMWVVILTVSLAAFLQGFVQSSINGATLYKCHFGLGSCTGPGLDSGDWRLGSVNAAPFLVAAVVGCPLSLPINYWFGRKGGMAFAASCIFFSSISAAFVHTWGAMFAVRVFNGIGMGVKAVSTPILASETAVGFWRGSAILAWQLWVAFGIMMGFAFNLLFTTADNGRTTFALIVAAPLVPSIALFIMAMFFCPESPRYHLMKGPNYSPERAYRILLKLRNTELQALRDMYSVHKSIEQEYLGGVELNHYTVQSPGFFWVMWDFLMQYKQLFQRRRLYNAVISTSVVNLAQQMCGVNVLAFYSGLLFARAGQSNLVSMAYSLGFGAINWVFALPAVRSIDILGRRKWLIATLPVMSICMLGAALSFTISDANSRDGVLAFFLFTFAVAYSPGLGPIPFTLASESFPLSHREAGTAWAISINLGFAGLLAMFYPRVDTALHHGGALGLFSGLNVVALVLVFFFVEETKRRSLEDLDLIFAVSKRKFVRFQVMVYLPWFVRRHLLRQHIPKPEFYHDMIWGAPDPKRVHSGGEDSFDSRKDSGPYRGPRGSFESADSRHA